MQVTHAYTETSFNASSYLTITDDKGNEFKGRPLNNSPHEFSAIVYESNNNIYNVGEIVQGVLYSSIAIGPKKELLQPMALTLVIEKPLSNDNPLDDVVKESWAELN